MVKIHRPYEDYLDLIHQAFLYMAHRLNEQFETPMVILTKEEQTALYSILEMEEEKERNMPIFYKKILARFLRDYLRDTGAENYFAGLSDEDLEDSISEEVLERFIAQLTGAMT